MYDPIIFEVVNIVIFTMIMIIIVIMLIMIIYWMRRIVNVPVDEAHIVTTKRKRKLYDGHGRYIFFSFVGNRIIFKKKVLIFKIPSIKLKDRENLPFYITLSCNVKMITPILTAETLGRDYFPTLQEIINNNVISFVNKTCSEKLFGEINSIRNELESIIKNDLTKTLIKYGFEPIDVKIEELNYL
ncbi:MAG: hypothetical protein EAX96_05140 [Candidatus Lokiarchaeota archaeon]|nr:hypothetical protein [Candidatus Lokiarchaeota archaeon]